MRTSLTALILRTALIAALAVAIGCDQSPAPSADKISPLSSTTVDLAQPLAEIKASVNSGDRIEVVITIPPHHHAYLDRGREENLIPIEFDWQSVETGPVDLVRPVGDWYEDVGATVLRRSGKFIFRHSGAPALNGHTFRVRNQICDEQTGVCYRPVWQEVTIGH